MRTACKACQYLLTFSGRTEQDVGRGAASTSSSGLPGGFDPPSSNVTWCPNQFFDVVLPHFPRGVVRLVGYLLWQTLAWNDEYGQPRRTRHRLTWRTLGARAGVSRGALGDVLRVARSAHFVRIEGAEGDRSPTATFELQWAEGPYVRRPEAFAGFFRGMGHRTYVPNQFFTVVVAREPLAVIRVVGAVIRESIGFEAAQGYRRTEAALSCRTLARRTRLSTRHVALALQQAIGAGYLQQVSAGTFGGEAEAARYALRWSDGFGGDAWPFEDESPQGLERVTPTGRGSKRSTAAVQKGTQVRFKKVYSSKEEIKPLNEILAKPAPPPALPSPGRRRADSREVGEPATLEARLREVGFSGRSVAALAGYPRERIERQIAWLADRAATRSPLGLLRRAIEEDWPPPRTARRRMPPPGISLAIAAVAPMLAEPTAVERRAYVAWMRERLEAMERTEPARFQAFLEHRERLKASLRYVHHDRPDHGILRGWDSDAARIAHLQAFDRTLPDLETWCRGHASAGRQCPAPSDTRAAMKNSQIAT
jgi:hypothetical protein